MSDKINREGFYEEWYEVSETIVNQGTQTTYSSNKKSDCLAWISNNKKNSSKYSVDKWSWNRNTGINIIIEDQEIYER